MKISGNRFLYQLLIANIALTLVLIAILVGYIIFNENKKSFIPINTNENLLLYRTGVLVNSIASMESKIDEYNKKFRDIEISLNNFKSETDSSLRNISFDISQFKK